jgi:hypothetical protein
MGHTSQYWLTYCTVHILIFFLTLHEYLLYMIVNKVFSNFNFQVSTEQINKNMLY